MSTFTSAGATRDDFDRLWLSRGPAPVAAAGLDAAAARISSFDAASPFVRFDPLTIAVASRYAAATQAAARSCASIAAAARGLEAGAGQALLRATASTGAALASTAVHLAAVDAAVLGGAALLGDAAHGASAIDDPAVAAAFASAAPASTTDDARVTDFAAAYPDVALPALLDRASAGDDRAASLLGRLGRIDALAAPLAAARAAALAAAGAADAALLGLLRGRSVQAIADAAALMHRIEALLPDGDGLKAFTVLYRMVTERVGAPQAWENQRWLDRLDVLFAELFFDGVELCLAAPATAPAAWRALMDRRRQPGIASIQFALAGMSAHINRDLAVAVTQTWQAEGTADHGRETPEFRDYKRVDGILDAVEPDAMRVLATGLFKVVEELFSPADDWAAMEIIHAARDLAWTHAMELACTGADTDAGRAYVGALDAVAAGVAQSALLSVG